MAGTAWVRLELGPQPLDVDVQRLGVPDVVAAPDPVDELSPGEHPARITKQELEQLELLKWHGRRRAIDRDDVAIHVHPHGSGLEYGGRHLVRLTATPEYGANASNELSRRKRLRHVVVSADLEADDLVDLRILGRQHD